MKTKLVVGLMSGTSVDGIDACLVKIHKNLSVEYIEGLVFDYPDNIKEKIHELFEKSGTIEDLCWMNFVLGEYFASAALKVISKAGLKTEDIDLIGSHGQTIYHIPKDSKINEYSKKSTLQIGEPSIIAERTGITTISDFRPGDIAAGGFGAPLVCFADEIFFRDKQKSRGIQNIGGMANVTVVSPHTETFAFDTGPGNVLIDLFTSKFFNQNYDKDGTIAAKGIVDENWLKYLMKEEYFSISPPKTTGRELFGKDYAEKILKNAPKNPYDIIATLTALTAKSIYKAYYDFIFPKTSIDELILGGGGAYNPEITKYLKKYFDKTTKILTHEDFGISNKFKEAMAFALLAYTTCYKIPNNVPSCTGASNKRVLGKIILGTGVKANVFHILWD